MGKVYLKVVGILAMLLFVFGFAGPSLISAKSTFAVLLGVALIIGVIPATVVLSKSAYTDLRRYQRIQETKREISRRVNEEMKNI